MSYCYSSDFVCSSPVKTGVLGADLENGAHKAVMFDDSGDVVLATDSSKAMGILLSSTASQLSKGDAVTFMIKDTGLMEVGEAVNCGDLVSVNDKGQAVVAKSGSVVFGRAFTSVSGENSLVQVLVSPFGAVLGG